MAGKLTLCPTPIGNLNDISLRMLEAISNADLIVAEDTRRTLKILNAFSIGKKPLTSYHEHNKKEKEPILLKKLKDGMNITMVSDAGMPAISDPGAELVNQALKEGIQVSSLPGPCAGIAALTMSGLSTRSFTFDGFLPRRAKNLRREIIESYKTEQRTIILYEAPHRLLDTLKELCEVLGDRNIRICKELTKIHEHVYSFTLPQAVEYFEKNEPLGEYVLLIEGVNKWDLEREMQKRWDSISLLEHLGIYQSKGMTKKEAMKQVAKDRGVSKRKIYDELNILKYKNTLENAINNTDKL